MTSEIIKMSEVALEAIRLLRQSGKLDEAERQLRALLGRSEECSLYSHMINIEAARVYCELGHTEKARAHCNIASQVADSPDRKSEAIKELAFIGFALSDKRVVEDCELRLGQLGSTDSNRVNLLTVQMLLAHIKNDFHGDLQLARQKLSLLKGQPKDALNLENLAAAYGDVGSRYARMGDHRAARSALMESLRRWYQVGKTSIAWANAAACLIELDLSDPHGIWPELHKWATEVNSNSCIKAKVTGIHIRLRYHAGDFEGVIELEKEFLQQLDSVSDQVLDISGLVDLILAHCVLGGQICQDCDLDRFELWKDCSWCNSKPERLREHLPHVEALLDELVKYVRRLCLKISSRTDSEITHLSQQLTSVTSALLLIGGSSLRRAVEIEEHFGAVAQLLSEVGESSHKTYVISAVESTFVDVGAPDQALHPQGFAKYFLSQMFQRTNRGRFEIPREGTLIIKKYRERNLVHFQSDETGSHVWSVSTGNLTAELKKHLVNLNRGDRMAIDGTLKSLSDLLRVNEISRLIKKLARVRVFLDDDLVGLQVGALVSMQDGSATPLGSLVSLVSGSSWQGSVNQCSGLERSVFAADGFRRIGLQELPLGCEEAVRVGEILNVRPFLRSEATVDKFLSSLRISRVVHVVSHGDDRSGRNGLVLADGSNGLSHLSPSGICKEKAVVDILFLSCCNGFQRRPTFGHHVSLINAFLFAGARCVLYYPLMVRDVDAFENSTDLYLRLQSGMTVGESLKDMYLLNQSSRVSRIDVAGDDTVRLN